MSSGCQNLNYNFSFGISYFKDIKKLRNKKNVVQGTYHLKKKNTLSNIGLQPPVA